MNRRANKRRKGGGSRVLALVLCTVMLLGMISPANAVATPVGNAVEGEEAVSGKAAPDLPDAEKPSSSEPESEKVSEESAKPEASEKSAKPEASEESAKPEASQPAEKSTGEEDAAQPESENMITITFMIDNPAYTEDPTSHWTHLTVPSIPKPVEGSGLHFKPWGSGTYKVLGTGALAKIEIPKGTSLEDNGLDTPDLSVTNGPGENDKTYIATRSWITKDNMICSVRTVFHEDTVLYLSLYTNQSVNDPDFAYSLDYKVLPLPGSISFGWSNTFKLGQKICDEDIPGKAIVDKLLPADSQMTFDGWQLQDRNTGSMVDFDETTEITSAYTNPKATIDTQNSIKVYAKLINKATAVTATFVNGDETVLTKTYNKGEALGALPDVSASAPEGQVFLGWRYEAGPGSFEYATPKTVINANTTYTAAFGTPQKVAVRLHDVAAYEDPATEAVVELEALPGTALSAAMDASGKAFADGVKPSACRWYSVSGEVKTPVELTEPVSAGMDLYTYTYRLKLTLAEENTARAASVAVGTDDNGNKTLTITAREGQPLKASDFVVDGVDYSQYRWMTADGRALDIPALIRDGLSGNVTASGDGSLNVSGMTAHSNQRVSFYVFVDGERKLLKSGTVTAYTNDADSSGRRYLPASVLESVYGKYGFKASRMTVGTKLFPHTETGRGDIWANAPVLSKDGIMFSPITLYGQNADVYYFPNQSLKKNSGQWAHYKTQETFYSVTVQDPDRKVYTEQTLPAPTYTLIGESITRTVQNKTGVAWECVASDGTRVNGRQENGNTEFAITGISKPYVIRPALPPGAVTITYDINLPVEPIDPEYEKPTIEGADTYTTRETGGTHLVLKPSVLSYRYKSGGKYLGEAKFEGWIVNNGDRVVKQGEILQLAPGTESVTLKGKWSQNPSGSVDSSQINFFVSYKAVPEGTTEWVGSVNSDTFTDSVYTSDCGLTGSKAIEDGYVRNSVDNQYYVLGGTSGDDLNTTHAVIVNQLTHGLVLPVESSWFSPPAITIETSFPSDEDVLRVIRQMVSRNEATIKINGKAIAANMLTTENFTIKWYVFKLDKSDGWHIDGLLVAKEGKMIVKKTFAGESAGIELGKEDFEITVQGESGAVHSNDTLRLTDSDVLYDPSTNTYTWQIPVDQYYKYTVTEQNEAAAGYEVTRQYAVFNSSKSDENTDGWTSYGSGVRVTGGASNTEKNRLTVALLNTYTKPGTVTLQKLDAATGRLMPGVSFRLKKGSEVVEERVTTDATGQLYLKGLAAGTYTLEENIPTGYGDPGIITFTLGAGTGNRITEISAGNGDGFVSYSGNTIFVKNYSRSIDVTVKKDWKDGENSSVKLQLYRGDIPLGPEYAVILNGNEATPWQHTFEGMPLYVNGAAADYRLREENIGGDKGFNYSSEFQDGYRYYDVTYSAVYEDGDGSAIAGMDLSDKEMVSRIHAIELTAHNERSVKKLSFTKTDQNGNALSGAEFWLYKLPDGYTADAPAYALRENADGTFDLVNGNQAVEKLKSAVSSESGEVNFGNLPAGKYYVIERSAPENYKAAKRIYQIEDNPLSTGENSVELRYWDAGQSDWILIKNNKIANTPKAVDVVIEKKVTGNMGDVNKLFSFRVTSDKEMALGTGYQLSADKKIATFELKDGQRVTLKDVTIGAVLTVAETNAEGYVMTLRVDGTGTALEGGRYTVTADSEDVKLVATNNKEMIVDNGVILDNLPYILILAFVIVGGVLFAARRRRDREER